jgi:hypothetical protein
LVVIDLDQTPPVERSVTGATDPSTRRRRLSWDPTSTRIYYERGAPPELHVIRVVE